MYNRIKLLTWALSIIRYYSRSGVLQRWIQKFLCCFQARSSLNILKHTSQLNSNEASTGIKSSCWWWRKEERSGNFHRQIWQINSVSELGSSCSLFFSLSADRFRCIPTCLAILCWCRASELEKRRLHSSHKVELAVGNDSQPAESTAQWLCSELERIWTL